MSKTGALATMDDGRVIVVTGIATAESAPDKVSFEFGVHKIDPVPKQAFAASEVTARKALSALQMLGIDEKCIQTSDIQTNIKYQKEYDNSSPIVGYSCTRGYIVTLKGDRMKLAEAAMRVVLENGANTMSNLEWKVSQKASKALALKAMNDAQAAATAKAQLLAEKTGVRLGPIICIEEGIRSSRQERRYAAKAAAYARSDAQESASISVMPPGSAKESSALTITFSLLPGTGSQSQTPQTPPPSVPTTTSPSNGQQQLYMPRKCVRCGQPAKVRQLVNSGWVFYCGESCLQKSSQSSTMMNI